MDASFFGVFLPDIAPSSVTGPPFSVRSVTDEQAIPSFKAVHASCIRSFIFHRILQQ